MPELCGLERLVEPGYARTCKQRLFLGKQRLFLGKLGSARSRARFQSAVPKRLPGLQVHQTQSRTVPLQSGYDASTTMADEERAGIDLETYARLLAHVVCRRGTPPEQIAEELGVALADLHTAEAVLREQLAGDGGS